MRNEELKHGNENPNPEETSVKKPKETTVENILWDRPRYLTSSLQEQVMPIVDLLAISNTHFQKLKDFIHMQLPSGFPVKIGK